MGNVSKKHLSLSLCNTEPYFEKTSGFSLCLPKYLFCIAYIRAPQLALVDLEVYAALSLNYSSLPEGRQAL